MSQPVKLAAQSNAVSGGMCSVCGVYASCTPLQRDLLCVYYINYVKVTERT